MTTTIKSSVLRGVEAVPVEVHVTHRGGDGQPQLIWKNFPEASQHETAIRVRSSLVGLPGAKVEGVYEVSCEVPAGCSTSGLDLPIAVGVLCEAWKLATTPAQVFVGELGLGGDLRQTRGLLAHLVLAAVHGRQLVSVAVPGAYLVDREHLGLAATLGDVADVLLGARSLQPVLGRVDKHPARMPDLADIKGHARAKRALEIAAAGGHSLLLVGAPGTGKTVLAQRLPGILPPLTAAEQLEVAVIQDCAGLPLGAQQRPLRAPHHTCSAAGLLGGGSPIRPGEVSLAHHGVLFLDELPEWRAGTIAALSHVLRDGSVTLGHDTDIKAFVKMPARPAVVVAAQNPCACGYFGMPAVRECRCSPAQRLGYQQRTSKMGLKFDLVVDLGADTLEDWGGEASEVVRERVVRARALLAGRDRQPSVTETIAALAGHRDVTREERVEAASFAGRA